MYVYTNHSWEVIFSLGYHMWEMGENLIVIFEPQYVLDKTNVLSNLRSYLEWCFLLEGFILYVLGCLCSFSFSLLFFCLILKCEGSPPCEKDP